MSSPYQVFLWIEDSFPGDFPPWGNLEIPLSSSRPIVFARLSLDWANEDSAIMGVAKIKDKSHIPVPRPGVPCQIGGQKIQRALADSRNFRENKDGESALVFLHWCRSILILSFLCSNWQLWSNSLAMARRRRNSLCELTASLSEVVVPISREISEIFSREISDHFPGNTI